jgi:hypothetical protein
MPGRVKKLIDDFVAVRSGGNQGLKHFVRAHLVLSGVNPDHYDERSPDDPAVVEKLQKMIAEFSKGKVEANR